MPLFHAVGFYSALVTTLSLNGTMSIPLSTRLLPLKPSVIKA